MKYIKLTSFENQTRNNISETHQLTVTKRICSKNVMKIRIQEFINNIQYFVLEEERSLLHCTQLSTYPCLSAEFNSKELKSRFNALKLSPSFKKNGKHFN